MRTTRTIFSLATVARLARPPYPRFGRVGLALWLGGGLGLSLGCLAACGSDTTSPVITNSVNYWQLQLNHHAATLALTAPYDTLQLVATPLNAAGHPIADTSTTTYRVMSNGAISTKVHVDAQGVLHADSVASNLFVIASRTIQGVTWTDGAVITVTDTSTIPVLGALTLSGSPTACTVDDYNCTAQMTATVTDVSGVPISPVAVAFSTSDAIFARYGVYQQIVKVTSGYYSPVLTFIPLNIGQVMVYAEATVYGRTQRDSLLFTVGGPAVMCVYVDPRLPVGHTTPIGAFNPGTVTIGPGGIVIWVNEYTGHHADVVFDNPSAVQGVDSAALANYPNVNLTYCGANTYWNYIPNDDASGSIPAWAAVDTSFDNDGIGIRARTFPTPGTYTYHSAEYGTSGKVIVLPH